MGAGKKWSAEELATLRRMHAEGATSTQIGKVIGRSPRAACRMAWGLGLKWPDRTMERPADFAERYAEMSLRNLGKHYHVSSETVSRWAGQLGLSRAPSLHIGRVAKPKVAKPKPLKVAPVKTAGSPYLAIATDRHERDMSPIGRAVDYLRKWGPVWYAGGGEYWRGSSRLTADEVLQRACSKGFQL